MTKEKTKICFLSPKSYPLFNNEVKATFGGAEVQLYMLGKELGENSDLDINFLTADYGQKEVEVRNNVKIWKTFLFKDSQFFKTTKFFRKFRKVNADVYVQRSLTPQSIMIGLYCRLKRKKYIHMVASDAELDGRHMLYQKIGGKFLIKLIFFLVNKIIIQNQSQRNMLVSQSFKKKAFILKKGLDFSKIKSYKERNYAGIWIGRSRKLKRIEKFLRLVELNPELKFLVICSEATNDEKYFKSIRTRCKSLTNLDFFDYLENEKIYEYLAKSKLFLFTSGKEGDWPMVVLESAASKTPILSYELNYEKLIDDYKGGILCNKNFDLMSSHFRDLIRNQEKRERMGENAYRYIMNNHNIETNAKNFLKIITNEKK